MTTALTTKWDAVALAAIELEMIVRIHAKKSYEREKLILTFQAAQQFADGRLSIPERAVAALLVMATVGAR